MHIEPRMYLPYRQTDRHRKTQKIKQDCLHRSMQRYNRDTVRCRKKKHYLFANIKMLKIGQHRQQTLLSLLQQQFALQLFIY